MSSISKKIVMLAISLGLSVSSPAQARSVFDLMSSDFDFKFPFMQLEEIYSPRIEADAKGDSVKISIEVPGIEANNLNVTVTDDELFVKGERKEEIDSKSDSGDKKVAKKYNSFQRTISFPCRVNSEKAEAKLKNGILTVTVPKGPDNGRRGKSLTIQSE
ncbi:MAG: Hsp20/alpha crystallin family protein [Cyanobacteria bacterium TGS_CYA1]|nr:Hsp20/alpha crystallin family protein [Cyanobacteria bacterium TGS_CYA1]